MKKKCQVDDNVSSTDQLSRGLASSMGENKQSLQNSRDADGSTVSSERAHSVQQVSIRSDVSSGAGRPLLEKRKSPSAGRAQDVISQGDSTTRGPYPQKQLKTDSSSSKESGAVARLSSVDSADPKPCESLSNCGYSHPSQSDETKSVLQEPESSVTATDPVAASNRSLHCKFDLNEGMEANGGDCSPKLKCSYSFSHAVHVSEPIPVVATVGVPVGFPKKPLQFAGELGWRSGITSAFRPTSSKNLDEEKGSVGNTGNSSSKPSCVFTGFDLNVAAMDSEDTVDDSSVHVNPKMSERFSLDVDKQRSKPSASGFDLNDDPVIEDTCMSMLQPNESRQPLRNCVAVGTTAFSGASANHSMSDCARSPYWVDMSSVRGMAHVQGQPFLLGAPTAQQLQMVVPIQLPQTAPGLYIGKVNSLTPTFYPSSVLPPLHSQCVAGVHPQISGPVFTAYPGNIPLLDSHQGLNLHAYGNMRQTFLPNGTITLMENGSRSTAELGIPPRSLSFEDRMIAVEQGAFPASSMRTRDPDAGWDSSQINCRQLASWN